MNISLLEKCVNDIPLISAREHCFSIDQSVIFYLCYPTSLNLSLQTLQTAQGTVPLSIVATALAPLFNIHIYWESPNQMAKNNGGILPNVE
jgi:hypothetical protein